jgi:hypothetical protein
MALSVLKRVKRKTAIVTHSAIRTQLPGMRITKAPFGLAEKSREGNQKKAKRKTARIQEALRTSIGISIRRAHAIE